MALPETLFHKGINQNYRYDEPGNLSKAVTVSGTNNQYPKSIGNQKGIIQPVVIFITEIAAENKVVAYKDPHGTIEQEVPTEGHTHLGKFTDHVFAS